MRIFTLFLLTNILIDYLPYIHLNIFTITYIYLYIKKKLNGDLSTKTPPRKCAIRYTLRTYDRGLILQNTNTPA